MEKFRITVPLSRREFVALSLAAQREIRPVRDQARYMLLSALGVIGHDASMLNHCDGQPEGQHQDQTVPA